MPNEAVHIHRKSEADAVRELAYRAVTPKVVGPDHSVVLVPEGVTVETIDTEWLGEKPSRKRGTVVLHDSDSFCAFVLRHKAEPATTIYADVFEHGFVGVLNDALGTEITTGDADAGAEWADHRAILTLRPTEEWKRWTAKDGAWFDQEPFAEFIEEGLEEIHSPPAAEMLELATSFHATTGANFRQAVVLQSGERKVKFDETIDARAGKNGELAVPASFELALLPFEGSPAYKVIARLRYRASGGKLTIGYKLVRPRDVQRDAFDDERSKIETTTGVPIFSGTAPEGVGR